jgi:hypothetical protein
MRGHAEMHDPPSVVSQHQEYVQDLNRRVGTVKKSIETLVLTWFSRNVRQEHPPGLRRWLPPAQDILAHAGLTDVDANFEQFAVDAGRTAKRILVAHFADQLANLFRHPWAPGLSVTNLPAPQQPETLTVPANDGCRLDNDQGRSPIAPNFAEPSPKEAIAGHELRPLHRATQDAELMPEGEVLQLKGSPRFEGW